jgi:hypothetical protein
MIKPPIFDVSGDDGAPGTSGRDYSNSTAANDGQNGGDGTDGQYGTSGGNISMRLATVIPLAVTTAIIPKNVVLANPIDAEVKLAAYFDSTGGRVQKMDTILKINAGQSLCFFALGGNGGPGGHGGNGQKGGKGAKYGAFIVLSFNEYISEYSLRTVDRMQLYTKRVLMAVQVATEEMAVTQVEAVMVDLEELFESLFTKPTLISLCSLVPSIILPEKGQEQGYQGWEVSLFRIILPHLLSEINFSIRRWRKGWGRRLLIQGGNK